VVVLVELSPDVVVLVELSPDEVELVPSSVVVFSSVVLLLEFVEDEDSSV